MKRTLILCTVILSSLLSSCAPNDPYVGKWKAVGPNSDQNDLEIEKSGDGYIWRDAQGTFKGEANDYGLLISRSLKVADVNLASVEFFCVVPEANRARMECSSKAKASVLSIEAGTYSYERK
jgi:hypothetical protein